MSDPVEGAKPYLSDLVDQMIEKVQSAKTEIAEKAANLEPEEKPAEAPAPGTPVPAGADGRYDLSRLATFTQEDGLASTAGDRARCSANGTAAALVSRGKDSLLAGVKGARDEIERRIADAGGSTEARAAWAGQLSKLDEFERAVRADKLDTNGLNEFSSVLYQTFDTNKGDDIMTYEDVARMQKAVGLAPEAKQDLPDPEGVRVGAVKTEMVGGKETIVASELSEKDFRAAQKRSAAEAFSCVGKGETATVGVFDPKDPAAKTTDRPNHFVLIGKTATGEPYCYDPLGKPNYFKGKAAIDHVASKVGVAFDQHEVAPDGRSAIYPLTAGVTLIAHPKT